MKKSIKTGLTFGATSWVITTLWLMIWLTFGSESKILVIWGILTIAIADSLSDALWIHISEESKNTNHKSVWISTFAAFLSKFLFTMSFVIPIVFFPLHTAILISIIRWMFIIIMISYKIARDRKEKALNTIIEHVLITILVIVLTYLIWIWIAKYFN